MSAGRTLVAAIVGGVTMFAWGAVYHMATPFGEMGVKSLPGEQMIMPALKFSIHDRGLYFFPGMDKTDMADEVKRKEWEARVKAGPTGLVIFNPVGSEMMSLRQLGTEFASNTLACLMLAIILSRVTGGIGTKMMMGAAAGVFGSVCIDASMWNWYSFPGEFAFASFLEQVVGGLLAGLAIGIVGRRKQSPAM